MCRHQACIYPSNDVSSAVTVAKATGVIQEPKNKTKRIQLQATTQRDPAVSAKLSVSIGMLGPGLRFPLGRQVGPMFQFKGPRLGAGELDNKSFFCVFSRCTTTSTGRLDGAPTREGPSPATSFSLGGSEECESETTDRACCLCT